MKCPHCGGEHPDTANFCPKSGKKISSSFASCPNPLCKADDIPNTFIYCPYCGSSMNNDEVSQSQEDVNFQAAIGVGCNDMENPDNKFVMVVDDIFDIKGRGVVLTGIISAGVVSEGDTLELYSAGKSYIVTVLGVEHDKKIVKCGIMGDHVGILVKGIQYTEVEIGAVLSVPGFYKWCRNYDAEVYMFAEAEGGLSTNVNCGYMPKIYMRNKEVLGRIMSVSSPSGVIAPGENLAVSVMLMYPLLMRPGTRFAIRENDRTVGAGIVTSLN